MIGDYEKVDPCAGPTNLAAAAAKLLRSAEKCGTLPCSRCVMQPGKPESWSCSFSLPSRPDRVVRVTVSARCPQCGGNMQLGSTQQRAAVFHCPACGHHEVHKDTTSEAIAREACRYVAEKS